MGLTSPEADEWLQPVPGTGGIRAFNTSVQGIKRGQRDLWAIRGPMEGVVVTGPDAGRMFLFYLHGRGLYGRVRLLAKALMHIAREQGLSGLACVTRDPVRMRMFKRAGARVVDRDVNYFHLELNDGR